MAPYDLYGIFGSRADPKRSQKLHIVPPQNGPKAAPAGEYWVAYEPDYKRHDENHTGGDAMSKLRPALRETDHMHLDENDNLVFVNPTEYAKRWGLHENGPPGRSRTSLTRSDTRTFQKDGLQQPVTGKWLAEYFERKSSQEDMDLRDWLEQNIPTAALTEDDKTYLGWLDEILRDEVWQGMLFHDFTMDELHEDDVFTMRDDIPKCDVRGAIHPMLVRENWLAPVADSGFGHSPDEPRWYYKVEGKQGEYDAVNNDELWEAMRPALLLSSRVLKEKPEFLNAILRIWDHKVIPPERDTRPQKTFKLKTFDTTPTDPNDPALYPATQFLRPIGDMYVAAVWRALASSVRFHIHGDMGPCGSTTCNVDKASADSRVAPRVFIAINPNMVFPLLVSGYSKSEKIMASYFLASIILHEIAHAFHAITMLALYRPDILSRSVAPKRDHAKFAAAAAEYFGGKPNNEPYFRNEPVPELGFSFQNWLFGNVASPFIINVHRSPVTGLGKQTVALRAERFPFFKVLDRTIVDSSAFRYGGPLLDKPVYDSECVFVNAPVNDVAPWFRQDFWMNAVRLYSLTALKTVAADYKIKATGSVLENTTTFCIKFFEGMKHARGRIERVMELLVEHGFGVARNYLNALMVERIQLSIGIVRWDTQRRCFMERSLRVARDMIRNSTIALEARVCKTLLQLRARNEPEDRVQEFMARSYAQWQRRVSLLPGGRPPGGSEALVRNGPDGFSQGLEEVVRRSACRRYLAGLPDTLGYLSAELQQMEQAIFEAYMLDKREMQHMLERFRKHWSDVLDALTTLARDCINALSLFRGEHADVGDWMTRFLELVNQFTVLKRYVATDQKKLNPVAWRKMFLSIGKGNAARKTPSRNWANLVREELSKMPNALRAEFEGVVSLVMAYSKTPPHLEATSITEQYSGAAAQPEAPGAFMDLVRDLQVEPEHVAAENLMQLIQEPGFNANDAAALRSIVEKAREQAARRQETRNEIQGLENELDRIQQGLESNPAYQAQEAVRYARERRDLLEGQIAGLQRLQMQHTQLQNHDKIHEEINQLQAVLEELLQEVNLRERYAEKVQEDPAVMREREFEQRLIEGEIQNLKEIERRSEENARARMAVEQREREAQAGPSMTVPMMSRMGFPPTAEDMLPQDATKRKREVSDEDASRRKRFRTEALRTLIEDPPFIGGPTRISGRPLPFSRCEQLEMPYGGLPEVRYEVEPLEVRGKTAIDVVERLAEAVERWEGMGFRQKYEVPRGAVEALDDVAGSESVGLPMEREWV